MPGERVFHISITVVRSPNLSPKPNPIPKLEEVQNQIYLKQRFESKTKSETNAKLTRNPNGNKIKLYIFIFLLLPTVTL